MTTRAQEVRGRRLVICGLGGQGIVFLSRVVAGAAMRDGDEVLTAETHGMAQRGGAVEAHLKMGGYASSLVRRGTADVVLALDPTRVGAAQAALGEGGACFANHPGPEAGVHAIDATGIATGELGYARGQNLVLLGFASATAPDLFPSRDSILASLDALSPPLAKEDNRRAFGRGADLA